MGQLKAFGDIRQVPVSVASTDESTARRTVGLLNLISIEGNMANACHPLVDGFHPFEDLPSTARAIIHLCSNSTGSSRTIISTAV